MGKSEQFEGAVDGNRNQDSLYPKLNKVKVKDEDLLSLNITILHGTLKITLNYC